MKLNIKYSLICIFILNINFIDCGTKKALVLGAAGFLGHHLINRLKKEGYWVRGVGKRYPEFEVSAADEYLIADLKNSYDVHKSFFLKDNSSFDEVYQLAAMVGGMGYISFHDAEIMHD